MKAWHFVGDTLRDGRPVPKDGELLRFAGEPILCVQGLHASIRPMDALQYAPGDTLCLVECGGTIVHGDDKLACTERTIVTRMDATEMLRYFARMQALSVVHLWEPEHVVLDFLMTGDESLASIASASAWPSARASAWPSASASASARASASASASARASASAWASASASAWASASDWASASARASASAWARSAFNALVRECFEDWL